MPRKLSQELYDALEGYHYSSIVIAAAELLLSSKYLTEETEQQEIKDCKLALQAVISTAPKKCRTALEQVCMAAIRIVHQEKELTHYLNGDNPL